MTKFEELSAFYIESEKAFSQDFEGCLSMLRYIFQGLIQYLESPAGQVEMIPVLSEITPGQTYGPAGAMELGEDSFYHFGIRVNLSRKPGSVPPWLVHLRFSVKRVEDSFLVKFGDHPELFEIHRESAQELKEFLDFVFDKVKDYLRERHSRFVDQGELPQKIGFI